MKKTIIRAGVLAAAILGYAASPLLADNNSDWSAIAPIGNASDWSAIAPLTSGVGGSFGSFVGESGGQGGQQGGDNQQGGQQGGDNQQGGGGNQRDRDREAQK